MMLNHVKSDRLTQLRELLEELAAAIDRKPGARDLAQLSKQYRETLKEIQELEMSQGSGNEIDSILAEHRRSWKRTGTD